MRRLRPAIALAALLVAAACGGPGETTSSGREGGLFGRGTLEIETDSGPVELEVEMAETLTARVRGLRFRKSLPSDAGMVFLPSWPVPEDQYFVMEDTLIPLSVAWWDKQGRIVAMLDMKPCAEDPCPLYYPGRPTAGAVEVNQGFFEDRGVEVGDRVRLER